ncbi:DUF411 domain-containing protein [Pseudooceanicola sp. LIPI14-2-Ac024]|uniref:DUF411 domain-containing protein n=1 Tax=Pseudooceanicola sp. LIPI14-2-Ac024 TaxID=3344875 RepID=UPI0035CEEF29
MLSATAFAVGAPFRLGAATSVTVDVARDPDCGCCEAWIDILERSGFAVRQRHLNAEALARHKVELGISPAMASCHTATVEGYVIEGHVPVADLRRLLADRPDALGFSVPGMPYGSPGMGPKSEREAFDVYLLHRDGSAEVYASYAAA